MKVTKETIMNGVKTAEAFQKVFEAVEGMTFTQALSVIEHCRNTIQYEMHRWEKEEYMKQAEARNVIGGGLTQKAPY